MCFLRYCIVFLFTCITIALQAQEIELNPVTVTATINPVSVAQTGRNIIVISGSRFSGLPVHSVDELLRYLPGMEVQARGPMGTQSDFTLRGGTFQQVLVIIDGIRLNDPNTGHFSSYIPIAPSEIDRIEILKGASSALYGSDAVGGVIHIITKTFAAKNTESKQHQFQAQVMAGEYGFRNATVGGMIRKNKTTVALGLLSNHADGQRTRGARGFFDLHTASASVSHQFSNAWQLSARTAFDYRNFGAQNYYTTAVSDTAEEKVRTFWNHIQLSYRRDKNRFTWAAGYKSVEDVFRFNKTITANENHSRLLQTMAIYEHSFSSATSLATGLQWQNRSINSNDRGNHQVAQAAAFAVLQQSIGSALTVSPALRYDWDERSGAELIPQLNVSFRMEEFQLRGSAGKTIRQADFTERYNNYNRALVPSGNRLGNPDLSAERSFSWEAGADVFAGKAVKISGTYFQRDHSNLIDYVATPYADMPRKENLLSTGNYFLAKNIARIHTSGFETDVQLSKNFGGGWQVFATAGAIWLQTENNIPPSLYISSHASMLTNFSGRIAGKRFAFSCNGLYKKRKPQAAAGIGARLDSDYFVMNARTEGYLISNKLSLMIQVDNVFDRAYSDLLGARMPGRWLMGGVQLTL